MSKHKEKQKLTGPWRNIHGAVWLIGLAVIAWQGWWWPGILVLVAISMILEAVIMKIAPDAVVTVTKGEDDFAGIQGTQTASTQTAPVSRSPRGSAADQLPQMRRPHPRARCQMDG